MAEKKLLEQIADRVRAKHYSRKTEGSYVEWARRYILFHNKRHPREMGAKEIEAYLSYLANVGRVSASTQNQCRCAILFMYREVLGIEIGAVNVMRAKEGKHLPTVLTKADTKRVLNFVQGEPYHLIVQLLYGAGLRLSEVQKLRIKDVDFENYLLFIRSAKGNKDRTVPLPRILEKPMRDQMEIARRLHEIDVQRGMPGVFVPFALDRKYPNIGTEWGWFWAFPSDHYSTDPETKIYRRHHIYESGIQRAVKAARKEAGITAHVTPHTFRHCCATHMLQDGYSIRVVQELLGHEDVRTTMIYTHCMLPAGEAGIVSPLDKMFLADVIHQ
jgi:integron integrase